MRYLCSPSKWSALLASIFVLLLIIAGCVISPRRIVNESPSPTPTPTISPTPTPTPTPTPAAAIVPAQFLFLGRSDAPLITAFRINGDGSLAPVPGSPFQIGAPALSLSTLHDMLIAKSRETIIAYKVDKETGALQQMDSAESTMVELTSSITAGPQTAVLDASGRFMYVADVDRRELLAYRVENGKPLTLSSSATPIASATNSMAIVKP